MGFSDYYKKRKEEEKNEKKSNSQRKGLVDFKQHNAASKFGLDTLSDDLNAMNSTLNGIYSGWQDAETMTNTRSSVEGMYNRLLSYEDYRTKYGNENFTDLSEYVNAYKTALDEWDVRSESYSNYKNADAYNAAVKKAQEKAESDAKLDKEMREADLDVMRTELTSLEEISKKAQEYELNLQGKKNQYNTWEFRARGIGVPQNIEDAVTTAQKERDDYFASIEYSSIEEIDKAIKDKNSFIENATILQNEDKALKAEDFEKYSTTGRDWELDKKDGTGNYITYLKNDPDQMKRINMIESDQALRMAPKLAFAVYSEENEYKVYNYYLGQEKEGLVEKGTADAYINSIMPRIEERWQNEKLAEADEFAHNHKVLGSIKSVGHTLSGAGEAITDMVTYGITGEMDDNFNARTSSTIRSRVSQDVDWEIGNWDAFDFVYNTGMSMVDSASVMLMPGASGAVVLGLSAAGQGVNDALDRGLDSKQAFWNGIFSGAFEMAFEKFSIGNFKAFKDASVDGWKTAVKNLGKTMLVNASEETATEIANIVYDKFAHGEFSHYAMRVQELIDSGVPKEKAIRKVEWEMFGQAIEAGVSGAFMGFGFGTIGNISAAHNTKAIGKSITANENVGKVFDMASVSPEASTAYEAYTQYANKGVTAENAKTRQVGALALNLKKDAYNTLNSKNSTEAQKEEAMKTLGDIDAYSQNTSASRFGKGNVKKLFGDKKKVDALIEDALSRDENTEAYKLATEYKAKLEGGKELSEKELTKLVDATTSEVKGSTRIDVEKRLVELGETENAAELSEIISKASVGQKLSSAEIEMLESNENASKVFSEMDKSSNVELMEAAEGVESSDRNLFVETYDGHTDVDYYKASFDLVSTFAKDNYSPDFILKHKGGLSERQVEHIYNKLVGEPLAVRQKALDELVAKHEGKLTKKATIDDSIFNGKSGAKLWRNLNSRQKQAIMFAKAFAKGAGINLKITYNGKLKGKEYNGYYDPKTNTIVIDARAGFDAKYTKDAIIPTMSHELTHWMKEKAPELYAELSRKIFGVLTQATGNSEYDLISDELASHPEYTDDQARDEIIARACEDLFSMSETGREIFNSLSAEEQNTLKAKIKEIVNNVLDWVNKLLGMYESKSTEAQSLRAFEAELQKIAKIWDQMLAKSIEANKALEAEGITGEAFVKAEKNTVEDNAQFCERDNTPNKFNPDGLTLKEQLKQALKTTISKEGRYVYVGEFTNEFADKLKKHIKIKKYPIVMNYRDAYLSMESKENGKYQGKNINYHNLGIDGLEAALKSFDAPEYVLLSTKESKIELILEGRDYKNRQLFSIIEVNTKAHNKEGFLDAHVVTSVYGNRSLNKRIALAEKEGRLIYDKNKDEEISQGIPPVQYQSNINDNSSSTDSILNSSEKNNKQIVNNEDVQFSEKEIVGESGKNYGMGVYLDNDRLSKSTDEDERIRIVKEHVKKIGGNSFIAYDDKGNTVDIQIAKASRMFKNKNGAKVPVNRDLTNYLRKEVKQESVVLIDELIANAKYSNSEKPRYPHDWLDNYGQNDWDYWKVYIQEKNKTVWEATLNIANSTNGEKILYDIFPIKIVEQPITLGTSTTNNSIYNSHQKNNKQIVNNEDEQLSEKVTARITADMSDSERTRILSRKNVIAPRYEGQSDSAIETNSKKLNSGQLGLVKKAIKSIAKQFGIIGEDIRIEDVDVEISLSKSNLKESVSKKATPTELAKLLPILKESVSHAIGIERHDNRYYFDSDTVYFENLLGGYVDGKEFVPVRFGLKHSKTGNTVLYVVVDQNRIPLDVLEQKKKTEVVNTAGPIKTEQTVSRSVTYSISQIIPFVKSNDLLRYIPNDMLNLEQKKAKWEAIAKTIKTTNEKNDKKYADFIASGNKRAANEMVVQAAKANGYPIRVFHGTDNFGFTKVKTSDVEIGREWTPFFATDSIETASTYSETEQVREVSDAPKISFVDEYDNIIQDIKSMINDLVDFCNRTIGIEDWIDDTDIADFVDEVESGILTQNLVENFSDFGEYWFDMLEAALFRKYENNEIELDTFLDEEYDKIADEYYSYIDAITAILPALDMTNHSGIYEFYANTDGHLVIDGKGSMWYNIPLGEFEAEFKAWQIKEKDTANGTYIKNNTIDISEFAKSMGYTGVTFKNILNSATGEADISPATVYAFFNPKENVKSADTITYDDNGNIIPLSERFNNENDDIRFSEKDYSYNSLVKKPDMKLTLVESDVPSNRADVVKQAIKNAKSVGYTNENGNAVVRVDDIKTDVIVPKKSIVHGLDRRMSSQAPVMIKIGEVLKNAIRVNELVPRSENAKNTYVLIGSAVNKTNELYIASFVVNRFTNEVAEIDVLYSANAKKESAALLPKITDKSATPTDSTISIADLLEYVNRYFPDILPESVLRYYGHTERPHGTLGESVLFSEKNNVLDNYSYDNLSPSDYYKNGKIYSYDFLVAQKNMKTVMLPELTELWNYDKKIDSTKVIKAGLKNAKSNGEERKDKIFVKNTYTGRFYRIDTQSIRHGLNGEQNRLITNARLGAVIGDVVKNAIPINALKNKSSQTLGTYALAGYSTDSDGREFVCVVTVEQTSGEIEGIEVYDVTHSISGRQKNNRDKRSGTKPQGVYPNTNISVDISISDFLKIVNSTHQSILSDDVLNHLGEQRNPGGYYSNKVLFSEKNYGPSAYDLVGEHKTLEKRYKKLAADFENYKESVRRDRTLTKGKLINPKQLEAVARFLIKQGDSNYKASELTKLLNDLYVDFQDGAIDGTMTGDEVYAKAYEVAEIIRSEAKVKTRRPAYYDMILKDLRSARVAPNAEQKGDAKQRFGDHYVGKFRGRVTIANDGVPLDQKWQEWASKYPSIFDKDISPAQQLVELYDIYDDLRNAEEVVVEYEESEMLHSLATEIINKAWLVTRYESTADKYDKRIKELNFEHRKTMEELKGTYKKRESDAKLLEQMYYGKLLHDLRVKRVKEVAQAKKLGRERLAQYRENAERKSVIQTIENVSFALNKKLTTNSKDVHIPEDLKPVVINLLNAIDFSSKRRLNKEEPTKRDFAIDNSLSKVHSMNSGTAPTVSLKQSIEDALKLFVSANNVLNSVSKKVVDDSIVALNVDMIEEIEKMLENFNNLMEQGRPIFVLQEMSTENLKTLSEMVRSIRHWASVADQTLGNKHKRRISGLSLQTIDENSLLKERQEYVEKIEGVKDFFNWSNLLPVNAFHRLGNAATELFDGLRDAQDKLTFNRQLVIDFMGDLIDKYKKQKINIKDWRTDVKTFDVQLPGEKNTTRVKMPVSFIMTLYCVAKQEDAKRHLYGKDASGNKLTYKDKDDKIHNGGGMTIKGYKEGKFKLKVNKNLDNTILNESIVKQITGVLTKEQIEVADAMQEFMDITGAEWGNAVSMALYEIKKFGIKNYFPLSVSPHTLSADMVRDDKASLFSILNYGLTKERNPNANQSIEIGDIFEVFANHMNMVAIYNAYALPIYDIVRWYNFKGKKENGKEISVTASIEKAFGKGAITYVNNLIKDLNGQHASSRLGFLGQILKNEKVAMVGYSLSVSLIQPVAYFKAMTKISPKYLLKAAMYVKDFGVKKGVEKSKKYCGIALLKSQGYFETGISTSTTTKMLHDESLREKAIELSLKLAEFMDERTWGVLWNACEFETRATRKDLKVGSEEFYRVVGEKLRDVIYETQVVDSPLTKSDLMRSPDAGVKMVTMFATELTVAYNMVYEAVYQANLYSKNPQKAENDFIKAHEAEYIKKYGDNYMERLERDAKEGGIKEAAKKNRENILMNLTAYALTSVASGILYTAVQNLRKGSRDDDDEDKELEDYIKEAWFNILSELHPISKIPYFKEILSIKEGYSPSMPGFSWLVSAFMAYKAFVKASEGKEGQILKAIEEIMKSFSYVSGLSIYNLWRELKGTLKTIGIIE